VSTTNTAEVGRLRLAGIGADGVAVGGQLGKALSDLVGRHRSVVNLTAVRPSNTVAQMKADLGCVWPSE